jgi:hypothetical protein
MQRIDAETVLALARMQQQDWIDAVAAERIAVGATAAVAAVNAACGTVEPGLLAADGAGFLAELEALAERSP